MEGISMARIKVRGNVITVSGRGADEAVRKLLMPPTVSVDERIERAKRMKFPEYSEKGLERLRELGKL